ncbi:MAG: hypothetical protein K8S99_12650 [Planctomycetes bacterium]|nr:hypothetical protein [Planctomycetota bacterium]
MLHDLATFLNSHSQVIIKAMILTAFVTTIAYIHNPRLKTLIFSMPVPFTCVYLASGIRMGSTHVSGLVLVTLYHWIFYTIYRVLKWPLGVGIAIAVTAYLASAYTIANHSPIPSWPFLGIWCGALALWMLGVWLYRPIHERGHRSKAPWWIKSPIIFAITLVIISLTSLLSGAVTTFPYAGVFTSYEMRHSPRTLAGQYTINNLSFLFMFPVIWLLDGRIATPLALLAGWVVLLVSLGTIYKMGLGKPQIAGPAVE